MNPMLNNSKLLAAALCGVVLAGCNAVESVEEAPYTTLPSDTVALTGIVTGLGSTRSIVILNNGDQSTSIGAVAPVPTTPVVTDEGPASVTTPFSFGALSVGLPYNITVGRQPYGKNCTVANGTGVLNRTTPPQVVITCVPNVTRYNVTVTLNSSFSNSEGAKVQLRTEEALYELPARGAASLTFKNVLFNGAGSGAPSGSPLFSWSVSATNVVNGVTNRCPVTSSSNPVVSGVTQNPTAHVTTPAVGACSFTIGGSVSYSTPANGTAQAMGAGGITLELRDVQGNTKATQDITAFGNFKFNDAGTSTPTQFRSNSQAIYDVVVTKQPAGQMCIVGDGGYVSLFVLVGGNPTAVTETGVTTTGATPSATATPNPTVHVNGTRLAVFCRNKPTTPATTLAGVFRMTKVAPTITYIVGTKVRTGTATSTITTSFAAPTTSTVVSQWLPFNTSLQNTASNAIMTFFDDGTFLYGQHNNSSQVEHGFYEYSSAAKTLRFTIHTDTNSSTTFPATAFGTVASATNPGPANTPGISAAPEPFVVTPTPAYPAPSRHQAMCNVQVTTGNPRMISGTFAGPTLCGSAPIPGPPANPTVTDPGDPALSNPVVSQTTSTATSASIRQLDWEMTEPRNVSGQMTGRWTTEDHREVWVYDSLTYYGLHVGVNGASPNLQSACFTLQDETASSSFLTRRGSNTGCYAWNNPAAGQVYLFSGNEAVDTSPSAATIPGFVGRMPGGGTAFDGRSPSPIYFHIAPTATWHSSLPSNFVEYFPTAPTLTWCPASEVLGVRATLNDEPVTSPIVPILNKPVYFCRQ